MHLGCGSRPVQIRVDVFDGTRSLDVQKVQFMAKLDDEKTDFVRDMTKYEDDLNWIKKLDDYQNAMKYATKITGLRENLERAKERLQSFQERERLFGIDVSEYADLGYMVDTFQPYASLWTAAFDWKDQEEQWLSGPLNKQNSDDIQSQVRGESARPLAVTIQVVGIAALQLWPHNFGCTNRLKRF